MAFTPTSPEHPIHPWPAPAQLQAMGGLDRVETFIRKRERLLQLEKEDPLHYGWEPSIWWVCDCLLGFPWVDASSAAAVRAALGFPRAVHSLLILGGNRAGKTEYAGKRLMKVLTLKEAARAWAFHTSAPQSSEYHHPLLWRYLPPNLRETVRTDTTYISYSQKLGFTDGKFVLPNRSECGFRNYMQDITTIEGGELDMAWMDELVPLDWVKTLDLRTATRDGVSLLTFTPIKGYTATVASFLEGSVPALESPAWLLPKDGGKPDVARALMRERFAMEDSRLVVARPSLPPDRGFQQVPRVMRCADPSRAVVYFHSSDNAYGNPAGVVDRVLARGEGFIKERFYGMPTKSWSARFSVDEKVHVVKPPAVPALGTNFMVSDPSSARNWFMLWLRASGPDLYVYREWPSTKFPVSGHGVPGPWAAFGGKKLDGVPGPGQKSFGFGLKRYKEELARLEGWEDALKGKGSEGGVEFWRAENGTRETIARRIMDSRFASAPRVENDRPMTLITEMEALGLYFEPAAGVDIDEGVQLIVDALDFDRSRPLGLGNRPRLYISSDCENLLYALRTWTGADGNKGATKDPVDCLRYLLLAEPFDWGTVAAPQRRNFHY